MNRKDLKLEVSKCLNETAYRQLRMLMSEVGITNVRQVASQIADDVEERITEIITQQITEE